MKLKSIFLTIAAAIGGIYLTSEEGKRARDALQKKKSTFDPIIKSLVSESTKLLEGSSKISSEEARANISLLASQAKKILLDIDLEKTLDSVQEAIQVASKKIRKAYNETTRATSGKASAAKKKTKKTQKKK